MLIILLGFIAGIIILGALAKGFQAWAGIFRGVGGGLKGAASWMEARNTRAYERRAALRAKFEARREERQKAK